MHIPVIETGDTQMTKIYTDRAEAQTEAQKLNAARKRTNIEYVVGNKYDWENGGKVVGYYIGMCSDD